MATQAYPYMVISDGTTTCTIQAGDGSATNYPLVRDGWAPAVAGLRTSPLAGVTPYEDVAEQMLIEVNGATAAAALANLVALRKLLEQAERWYRGENETAVLVKFAPQGSTVSSTAAPLQAAILGGGAGSGDPGVKLAPQWDEVGRNYVIPNVLVSFTRRGLWLLAEETATSASANNGDQISATFAAGAQGTPSPLTISISNYVDGKETGVSRAHGGFLLVGDAIGGVVPFAIVNAEGATATGYTSVTPAGSTHPRNTNVLRYTPTGTSEANSGAMTPTLPDATDLVAIFANIRPSATVSFTVRAKLTSWIYNQYTPYVTIAANATQYPKWYFLGVVAKKQGIGALYLAITAASASSNLDIDTVVVCDARATQILALPGPSDSDPSSVYTPADTLLIDHQLLTKPNPAVTIVNSLFLPYLGDAVFMTKAATLYALLLATGGGSGTDGDEYRQAASGGDTLLANVLTAKRRPAYVVPQ